MKNLNLHQVRKEFLEFFKEKDHLAKHSYSLVPKNDKSLLLIGAGMAPLKPYFLGKEEPPNKRMTTCQKCVRTGDIENVGKTDRHGTFFEMLGNFSFGDYFKEESIKWAWEFMTEKMEVSKDLLWISIYKNDDEAFKIWNEKIGVPKERIVRLGKEDNFWELEVGPCGPCSEIYIDRGKEYGCDSEDCQPGCDCDRYVEVWNLVFSQYDKDESGNYNDLPNPNIDTGMGLERMAVVLQEANNIFEIEPIRTILKSVEDISQVKYKENDKNDTSLRVITDHIRAVSFMVCDGVIPSNEGRGYVLRRLIRRAARHGKLLGIKEKFLYKLSSVVIKNWMDHYPELKENEEKIKKVIKVEEEKFEQTIDQGMDILDSYISKMKKENLEKLNGENAFKLYDTYGFPLDLTKEILEEKGYKVDEEGFNKEMEKQRQRARMARENKGDSSWNEESTIDIDTNIKTEFKGYTSLNLEVEVIEIIKDNEKTDQLSEGKEGIIILDKTPFYAEGGGQIGDKGKISNENVSCEVSDTKKPVNDTILHFVKVNKGTIKKGDKVKANVIENLRRDIQRNHTATHLLHKALKKVLGEHVNQAGSLVTEDRLRFDFTHFEGLTDKELNKVEEIVNSIILETIEVETFEKSMDEAKKMGATGLFEDKYGETVRIVKVGDFSIELCGGTHVSNSNNIGLFKIISESGIASGVRRIEAVTGRKAYENMKDMENEMEDISKILKTNKSNIVERIKQIDKEYKNLEKEIDKLKSKLATSKLDDILNDIKEVNDIKVITKRIDGMDIGSLRELGDKIRNKVDSVVIVLATVKGEKVNFIAQASKDLVKKGIHSGNIIREVAKVTGGGGGGRPDMAQAGGKDSTKVDKALSKVIDLVKEQID
ncbi:MAG: alanine--tRNA ligase [Firmicutes bacterium]|nr:alanine--tRNA ligase [Bacillota bacterium]